MGLIQHRAIVATTCDAHKASVLERWAREMKMGLIRGPTRVNDTITFMLPPDGSKEGWPQSDDGDAERSLLIGWLVEHGWNQWVEVSYGEEGARTERTS